VYSKLLVFIVVTFLYLHLLTKNDIAVNQVIINYNKHVNYLVDTLKSPSIDNHHLADEIAILHPSKCIFILSHYKEYPIS